VTDECIHGFPTELCDICTPRQAPEPVATKPAPRRTRSSLRTPPSLRTESASTRAARTAAAPELPTRVFSALRAHHFTHLDNLGSIALDGALRASTSATPDIDVLAPIAREVRAGVQAPDGSSVADHVPFTLSPDGSAWADLRSGAADARWSDAARRSRASEYIVLVVPTTAFGSSVIVADGPVEDRAVRFAVGPEAATDLLRRTDLTDPEMLGVELLAGPEVPLSAVAVIGVPNDRARADVRALLADVGGHAPRVAVFPPWFASSSD
jgi:hypothetical protein